MRLKLSVTRRHSFKLAFSALCGRCLRAAESGSPNTPLAELACHIPSRAPQALTGSQFAESVLGCDRRQREDAILEELAAGNVPEFLRKLVPIKLDYDRVRATAFVMPEYLAIGSDHDFLRIPMNLHTARTIAERFGFVLPTKKMVDRIYDQSFCRFVPQPLPAGPPMISVAYYLTHNAMIDKQAEKRAFQAGALVAGHKKDVVLTNRLRSRPDRIAIYGWHRASGDPIQPLSTVHGAGYADYSHGIRLVSRLALINGTLRPIGDILRDSALAMALSDEGPIRV